MTEFKVGDCVRLVEAFSGYMAGKRLVVTKVDRASGLNDCDNKNYEALVQCMCEDSSRVLTCFNYRLELVPKEISEMTERELADAYYEAYDARAEAHIKIRALEEMLIAAGWKWSPSEKKWSRTKTETMEKR